MSGSATITPPVIRLEGAPPSAWAKHRHRARRDLRRLLLSWWLTGRWHYPVLLLGRTGQLLAREKYSAFAVDHVYRNLPEGWAWIGRRLDRYLLDLPVHRAVRARFDFVVRHGTDVIGRRLGEGVGPLAVLSVPCGLARDLCTIYARLRVQHRDLADRLVLYGLDLDWEGTVLEEARRRAARAGVPLRLVQANALHARSWEWLARTDPPLLVVSCIGLGPWLTAAELRDLLVHIGEHLQPGGHVLIDRWNQGRHARWGRAAEIHATYHTHEEYQAHFRACGYAVLESEVLGASEGMAYLLTRAAGTEP